jgi:hypothetical protein
VTRDCQFCSVNVIDEQVELERLAGGERTTRITWAKIDHVTICASPVYSGTGIWPADVVGELPPRVAQLAARWEAGRRIWLDGQAKRRAAAAVPWSGAALGSTDERAGVVRAIVAELVATRGSVGPIGHVAFSKAAGFSAAHFRNEVARVRMYRS